MRETVAGDTRSWRLSLTAAGRRLVPQLALADANDEAFFGHLGMSP